LKLHRGNGLTVAELAIFTVLFTNTHAQGPLTPPGPPAPMMKTLDQIEPRVPIAQSDVPVVITIQSDDVALWVPKTSLLSHSVDS